MGQLAKIYTRQILFLLVYSLNQSYFFYNYRDLISQNNEPGKTKIKSQLLFRQLLFYLVL